MINPRHIGATILLSITTFVPLAQKDRPPNVLMICVDELLPALGCYGNEEVYTPHIDLLAASSALFTKHYVTVPTCGASRYSLLRSRLPRSKAELGNNIA